MNKTPNQNESETPAKQRTSWGPKLFMLVLTALLAFFYWLLIYSGGVTVYHG
ncbi:MAG: hypothetical protein KZQ93_14730 [Candidatus Thiodiazotropha sp. (ex Monitilora ramsayi)]|nr:hypothetical protein [Candidatus Thiodiazotropha sp. (ex Monitilora ramsayi)]